MRLQLLNFHAVFNVADISRTNVHCFVQEEFLEWRQRFLSENRNIQGNQIKIDRRIILCRVYTRYVYMR